MYDTVSALILNLVARSTNINTDNSQNYEKKKYIKLFFARDC